MIRFFFLFLAFLGSAHASGSVALTKAANVAGSVGAYVTAGPGTVAAASFNSAFTTQVAGKAVTMPASYRFAANAARIGVGAVRLSPAGLIGGAVASWLLTQGISWVADQFGKQGESVPLVGEQWSQQGCVSTMGCGLPLFSTANEAATHACTTYYNSSLGGLTQISVFEYTYTCTGGGGARTVRVKQADSCPTGYVINAGSCAPTAAVPVTEADWEKLATSPLPDAAAAQLAAAKVPLPLENPVFNPTSVEVPLNDPTINPETGKYSRDIAILTPSSTNPEEAKLDVVERETDANGNAVTNASGGTTQDDTNDPCLENPGRIGCSEWGKPDDVDLETNTKNIVITPQGGFGPDSAACPADLTYTIRQGTTVRFSYDPVCKAADMFRPVVIGLAWLTALLLFIGISRRAQS